MVMQVKNFVSSENEANAMKYAGKNVLCLRDKANLTQKQHIAFETCNQNTYAKRCASQSDIDKFIANHPVVVVGQKTIVMREYFSHNTHLKEKFPI